MVILDLLYPKACLECGKREQYICTECLAKVPKGRQRYPYGPLERHISLWSYEEVVRKAISALKYRFAASVAAELAELASQQILSLHTVHSSPNTILIPIPLHKRRQNWRGFNQAEKLGSLIAKNLGWGYRDDVLVRVKGGAAQVGLNKKERVQNISGKFAVNSSFQSRVGGLQSVVLFDDVYTTGSTLNEAARALKRAGAKKVWGLTIAG